jgi:MATE family multidrug resistance protein
MNKEILRLAIPNILSNLSIPLLSTVDTALMGRLSEVHIGAVGIAAMIFNFVYWNFGFLRMGTTGITAQYFGSGDRSGMIETFVRACVIAISLGLLMLIFQWPLRESGIALMQADSAIAPHIAEYFNIRIWAAPATLISYAAMGWFFGMQNAVYPLIITIGVNVLNIILSYILVFQFNMEIAGVAWGTVVSQYFGLLLIVLLFAFKYKRYLSDLRREVIFKRDALRRFLQINRDIFLRTLSLTFAFGFFYSQSSSVGEGMLAVNIILLQYVNWLSYAIDGFAFATESIVGKYFGAKKPEMTVRAIKYNFIWGFVVAGMIALFYGVAGDWLLGAFTDQENIIAAARPYLFWMVLIPLLGFWCYIWDGVYVGLTASVAMRDSMAIALGLFLAAYYLILNDYGNHGLWLSLVLFLSARGVLQWIWYLRAGLALK